MPHIYFITHPEVEIDPEVPINEWALSEIGRSRVNAMLKLPWIKELELICSSEEPKAHQTAEIIAGAVNLPVLQFSKLGEVDRSSTGYLMEKELGKTVSEFFLRPQKSIAGWEKAAQAQKRIVQCITDIVLTNPKATIAIFSHGMVGALFMCSIKNIPLHKRYVPRTLGSYFIFDSDENEIIQEWRLIDPT